MQIKNKILSTINVRPVTAGNLNIYCEKSRRTPTSTTDYSLPLFTYTFGYLNVGFIPFIFLTACSKVLGPAGSIVRRSINKFLFVFSSPPLRSPFPPSCTCRNHTSPIPLTPTHRPGYRSTDAFSKFLLRQNVSRSFFTLRVLWVVWPGFPFLLARFSGFIIKKKKLPVSMTYTIQPENTSFFVFSFSHCNYSSQGFALNVKPWFYRHACPRPHFQLAFFNYFIFKIIRLHKSDKWKIEILIILFYLHKIITLELSYLILFEHWGSRFVHFAYWKSQKMFSVIYITYIWDYDLWASENLGGRHKKMTV